MVEACVTAMKIWKVAHPASSQNTLYGLCIPISTPDENEHVSPSSPVKIPARSTIPNPIVSALVKRSVTDSFALEITLTKEPSMPRSCTSKGQVSDVNDSAESATPLSPELRVRLPSTLSKQFVGLDEGELVGCSDKMSSSSSGSSKSSPGRSLGPPPQPHVDTKQTSMTSRTPPSVGAITVMLCFPLNVG
jgi:hypothetical protein